MRLIPGIGADGSGGKLEAPGVEDGGDDEGNDEPEDSAADGDGNGPATLVLLLDEPALNDDGIPLDIIGTLLPNDGVVLADIIPPLLELLRPVCGVLGVGGCC